MSDQDKQSWVTAAVAEYERRLLGYALHLLGDVHAAADVVQDAFCQLCLEKPEQLNGHLAAWLFTVVRHRALDRLRKEQTIRAQVINGSGEADAASIDPPRILEQADSHRQILRALDRLPGPQQEVVRLKFQQGLSYKQIAAVTGHTVTNVGFLLHTAIKTIRQKLNVEPTPSSSGGEGGSRRTES